MNKSALSNLAHSLGAWANMLPAKTRKRIYNTVKMVAALCTVALLVLPDLPLFGVTLPDSERWTAIATGVLWFCGQLASRNTVVPPALDMTEAPEPTP